jgi:hypothetical protein
MGTKIRIAIQIGNAVPPVFAQAIGEELMRHLEYHKARHSAMPKLAGSKLISSFANS